MLALDGGSLMKIYTGCEQDSNMRWRAVKKRYYMLLETVQRCGVDRC